MDGDIKMRKINVQQIDCGLSIGKIYTGSKKILLYLGVCLPFLIPIASIGIFVTTYLGLMNYSNTITIALVLTNFFAILIISVCFIITINNNKNIKKIESFLLDAVEVSGVVRRIDLENINYKPYQVQVTFEFNGKQYNKISSSGTPIMGYRKCFVKYCKNKINLLYSASYDEILFLKT